MHKDCYVPPDKPKAVPPWHLSLLCFNPACGCTPKSERYQIAEVLVKFAVVLAVIEGIAVAIIVL